MSHRSDSAGDTVPAELLSSGYRSPALADPELDTVRVFRPTPEGRLARVVALAAEDGGVLTTPLLPGCLIDVRELFRKLI